jgi:PrtD family type I secretion system ABC transporter
MVFVVVFSAGSNLLQLALPLYSMQVYDRVLTSGSVATLVALSLIVGVAIVAGALLDALRAKLLVRLANVLELHWRVPLVRAALCPDRPRLSGGAASLHDLDTVKACVTGPGMAALADLPWSLLFTFVIFALSPLLGWLTVAAGMLLLTLAVVGEAASGRWSCDAQAQMRAAQRCLDVSLWGQDAVVSMGAEGAVRRRVTQLRDGAASSGSCGLDRSAWCAAATRGLRSLLQMAILMTAAWLVLSEQIPAGVIVASSMLFARALAPIERVAGAYRHLRAARDSLLLLLRSLVAETDRGRALSLPPLAGHVEVKGLTGRRSPTAATSLQNVSFGLRAGEVVALLGATGSGKSTLGRLLVGATRPTAGTVRLDGAAVADWDPEHLGRQVGYVSQEPQLLEGTVAEVIARFGPIDDDKVVAAARRVGAHDLILRLPHGYRTTVGGIGGGLSVGERQYIALARAFYGEPKFLVLDEPTAHLDNNGEQKVLVAIAEAKSGGATVVVVSRLPSLRQMADHLLMLENGRMKFFRPHLELEKHLRPRLVATDGDAPDPEAPRLGHG